MSEALTKKEICQRLRKRCWYRRNWMWYNLTPGFIPAAKKGVTLREAASLECLLASEDLTERPKPGPTPKQYRDAEIELALAHAGGIYPCARCGWPVWFSEQCKRCGQHQK